MELAMQMTSEPEVADKLIGHQIVQHSPDVVSTIKDQIRDQVSVEGPGAYVALTGSGHRQMGYHYRIPIQEVPVLIDLPYEETTIRWLPIIPLKLVDTLYLDQFSLPYQGSLVNRLPAEHGQQTHLIYQVTELLGPVTHRRSESSTSR